jgi:hypothetical protein
MQNSSAQFPIPSASTLKSSTKAAPLATQRTAGHRKRRADSSDHFSKRLAAYAAAVTGVAAVSLPAMAQEPVLHHIQYTPASIPLTEPGGTPVQIDMNHDGIIDFTISATGFSIAYSGHGFRANGSVFETPAAGNFAIGSKALVKGQTVDKGGTFSGAKQELAFANFEVVYSTVLQDSVGGPFANAMNKYLGVKFQINGQTHEGWIRLTISCNTGFVAGTITGYAYDTAPGEKGIGAGQIRSGNGGVEIQKLEREKSPVTLGMLGLGAPGLMLWR